MTQSPPPALDRTVPDQGRPQRSYDRSHRYERRGSIGLVLALALLLVLAAAGLMMMGRAAAQPYVSGLLAFLAVVGLVGLFAMAAGLIRMGDPEFDNRLARVVADGAGDGVAVTEASGRVIYANPAYLALTGDAAGSEARPIERAFIGDPDLSEAIYRLAKAAREGRRLQEEVRLGGRNAPARWLRLRVRPLGEDKDDARYAVWSIADITRDRERQENVFQELKHAIDYLDHAPAGFFSVGANGDITYLNATLAEWLGHDLAEIGSGGLRLSDIVSGDGAALLTTLSATPGAVRTEILDIDFKDRAGQPVPVRLFHKVAFGADGLPGPSRTLVLNRARDDERDPQRAAEIRFMRFFHNTPMAIATIDRTGRILRTNARFARMFESVIKGGTQSRSIATLAAEADRGEIERVLRDVATAQSETAPVEVRLAGGGERYARIFVAVNEDAQNGVSPDGTDGEAAIVYALETTEQKSLENQFNQSQKMQAVGQLAGGIAHDFNNVLSAIMMATDFLLTAHQPTDPSFQDIMQIKQNANRAASLVRQLLAFSRRQTLRPQVLDLGENLSDLNMLLRRLIGEKVRLEVSNANDLWPVKVDLSQFEQVIVNLAVNARDAMPEGGTLSVRTANVPAAQSINPAYVGMPAGDYVRIEVGDSGTGIPPEIIGKIFDPFFTTKEVNKGTGLGLSTVYGIIKQTGGYVYVDSEMGKGTTFRIFLPRHVPGAAELAEAAEATAAPAPKSDAAEKKPEVVADLTGRGTILLVEDELGLRALNARGLRSRGYTVIEAGNGVEALAALEEAEGEIDLVVSDVVMPEMDGPTLLKEARQRNPEIKFIFVSGYAEDAFEKSLPEGGQFSFLAKPFTLRQLIAAVKETASAP